jgi:hypothetical protein
MYALDVQGVQSRFWRGVGKSARTPIGERAGGGRGPARAGTRGLVAGRRGGSGEHVSPGRAYTRRRRENMVANWLRHSSEAVPRVPFEISPLFSSPFRRSSVPCTRVHLHDRGLHEGEKVERGTGERRECAMRKNSLALSLPPPSSPIETIDEKGAASVSASLCANQLDPTRNHR